MRVHFIISNWRGEDRSNDLDIPDFIERAIAERCGEAKNDLDSLEQKHAGLLSYVGKLTEALLTKKILNQDEVLDALDVGPKAYSPPFRNIQFTQ